MLNELPTLLIVDDDAANLASLQRIFSREPVNLLLARDGQEALRILRQQPVAVCITDLMMPNMDGFELLRAVSAISEQTAVILMTAFGTVEKAVEAMKEGAYDFITKPFKRIQIVRAVARALENQELKRENTDLKAKLAQGVAARKLVGNSIPMRQLNDLIDQVAPSHATVLITGESGTGKEMVARAIHQRSQFHDGPFIALNCAALPQTLLEAELFGHEKGAFTGAQSRRIGRFEAANNGTLFIDEVAEMTTAMQVKLLRVLQESEFERVGGNETIQTNARIVAATNKNLPAEVQAGRFRQDLYYRLNVIHLPLPSLAERSDDIPLLAQHFLTHYNQRNNKNIRGFTQQAMDNLMDWHWPGNVRELENVVERAVVLCRSDMIDSDSLPTQVTHGPANPKTIHIAVGTPLEEIEERVIRQTLIATKGDKKLAAQLLGIATRTIYRKLG